MGLFHGLRYALASSLPPQRQEQLEYALSKNGAVKADSIANASHLISNSNFFEGSTTLSYNTVVVSDSWVDRSLVLGKIQPPQYHSVDPAMLFSGCVACAAELPTHDLEVLSAGITALGGQWRTGLTNDVTHLFAISPNSHKYATALAHRESTGIRILLPHWFDDSVRLGLRNLTLDPYLWPDPPLLKQITGTGQNGSAKEDKKAGEEDGVKKAMMTTANMFTASPSTKVPIPRDADLMPVKRGAWSGKKILLSWTLSLYGTRREAVEVGIRRAGGEVLRYPGDNDEDLTEEREKRRDRKEARAVPECDILVTRWRNGKAYATAFRGGKTIGTLAWMYHVQSTGLMPRPVDQLLHYPVPRNSIEGFSAHEVTVTNYTGEAREYIKRMITAMGATFTPSMSGRNTVLIAAYLSGVKADKARAWSIPIVNHTWLEDCFIQWRNLTVGLEKYIVFPPGVDFSKLLGERGVGVRGVELCDEEEGKEGSDSEASDGGDQPLTGVIEEERDTTREADAGEVPLLGAGGGDELDVLGVPDTDTNVHRDLDGVGIEKGGLGRQISESVSPAKRRPTQSLSPSKRSNHATPSKPKHDTPTKRRRIIAQDEDSLVGPESKGEAPSTGRKRKRPSSAVMDVDDDQGVVGNGDRKENKQTEEKEITSGVKKTGGAVRGGLLKTTRGDARTRVRAKSATSKTRMVFSSSEDEVEASVVAKAKKVKRVRMGGGVKTSRGSGNASSDEERPAEKNVNDESTGKRVSPRSLRAPLRTVATPSAHSTPKYKVSVVVDPPSALLKNSALRKRKHVSSDTESTLSPESESESDRPDPRPSPPRLVRKGESIRIEAGEKGLARTHLHSKPIRSPVKSSPPKPKQRRDKPAPSPTSSSPLSVSHPPATDARTATHGKRGAAAKAEIKLKEMMPDATKFEAEMKKVRRSGGTNLRGIGDWEVDEQVESTSQVTKKKRLDVAGEGKGRERKKRQLATVKGKEKEEDSDEDGTDNAPVSKSEKKGGGQTVAGKAKQPNKSLPPSKVYLMTTQADLPDLVIKALEKLGVSMTMKPSQCTHLIAPHLVRTEKFLCALSAAPLILDVGWATKSAAAKQLLPVDEFLLHDKLAEAKYGFTLSEALARAEKLRGKLLAQKTFYVTPKTPVDFKLLRTVASAHGGQLVQQPATVRIITGNPNRYVISCPADISIWRPLAAQGIPIYTHELLLTGVLKQELEWDNPAFKVSQ